MRIFAVFSAACSARMASSVAMFFNCSSFNSGRSRNVPKRIWRWRNLSTAEIACRDTGQLKLHPALGILLEVANTMDRPARVFVFPETLSRMLAV